MCPCPLTVKQLFYVHLYRRRGFVHFVAIIVSVLWIFLFLFLLGVDLSSVGFCVVNTVHHLSLYLCVWHMVSCFSWQFMMPGWKWCHFLWLMYLQRGCNRVCPKTQKRGDCHAHFYLLVSHHITYYMMANMATWLTCLSSWCVAVIFVWTDHNSSLLCSSLSSTMWSKWNNYVRFLLELN